MKDVKTQNAVSSASGSMKRHPFHYAAHWLFIISLTFSPQTMPLLAAERPQPVKVEVSHTPLGKRAVFLNGRATPLFWAYGLKDATQLENYKKAGFNTVYVDVRWVASEGVDRVIANARLLARAAEAQGLFVIYGIECVPTVTPTRVRIAPDEDAYVRPLKTWIEYVVEELGDTPNLIGWGTQHAPSSLITYDDLGFRRWLLDTYKTPESLNLAWGTEGVLFDNATMELAVQLDAQGERPGGLGEPTLDVAIYRWTTFAHTMELWAHLVRQKDRRHLLVTGRLNDYKSIISVPDNYDVVVPAVYPTEAEVDLQAHNAHAVDMARQANQFIAVPALMTRGAASGMTPTRGYAAARLQATAQSRRVLWMRGMAMHGAFGVAFQDWNDFAADEGARLEVAREIEQLSASPLLAALPTPTVAMLYEPIAEGAVVEADTLRPTKTLYGFGAGVSLDEPNNLFFTYRRGMKYGQVDYLSHGALLKVDLSRYAVILAPLTFYLSPQAQAKLREFVAAGGVLVADIGAGMVQSGGDLRFLPEPLQPVFGVYGITRFAEATRNMVVMAQHPLFPSLSVNDYTTGTLPGDFTFTPPIGFVRRYPDAINVGLLAHGTHGARAMSVTLGVHPFGEGFAIYAPFRLWSHWLSGCQLYQEFHGDLFRRSAIVDLLNTRLLTPLALNDPMPSSGAEVGTTIEGAMAFNPLERAQFVRMQTIGVRHFLFSGALTTYVGSNTLPPAATHRRVGITEFAALLDQPLPVLAMLNDFLPPGALHHYRILPIQLLPASRSATAQVIEYGPDRVQLNVWTDITDISLDAKNNVVVSGAREARAQLTLMTGAYVILPNSKHRITITPIGSRRSERKTLTATAQGLLVIERRWKAHTVTIEPVLR